eukprot:PITA_27225
MVDCKPITTPMELDFKKLSDSVVGPVLRNATEYHQLVEALMFLVNSHPDICFAVNTLSQHMVEPHHIHWISAKNLLRYLRGTITYGLRYTVGDVRLLGYIDADWAGSVVDQNPVFHDRSKHIDIKYHYIRDMVQRGAIRLQHIDTDEQVADILTKPLGKVKFFTFRERLGVIQKPSNEGPV